MKGPLQELMTRYAVAARRRTLAWLRSAGGMARVSSTEQRQLRRACAEASAGGGKRLLMVSQIAAFDKGSCDCWRKMLGSLPGWSVLHLSETPLLSRRVLKEKLGCTFYRARYAAFPLGYPTRVSGRMELNTPGLREAKENLAGRFPDLGEEGAGALSLYLKDLFTLTVRNFHPDVIMTWNAFSASHRVLREVAEEQGVPLTYMEFGLLPGTYSFDAVGQMGESALAREKPVRMDEEALKKADRVLDFLGSREMNRNAQTQAGRLDIQANGRKVITFFGQSDYASGIVPYTEEARKWHSPLYRSTKEALWALAEICERNDWCLVFRDHPAMRLKDEELPKGVQLARNCNLFELLRASDLAVTLMSQVSYEAALHDTNVLMLGRNQMSGKGCVWEATTAEAVEETIRQALTQGWTQEMRQAFRHHIAHIVTDVLFDDGQPRDLRYGRPIGEIGSFLESAMTGRGHGDDS